MAFKIDGFVALTGGGTGALDKISVADKVTNDAALGVVSSVFYVYRYNSASSAAEDSPNIIAPDTGTGRWELVFTVDTDTAMTADADNRTPSQKAVKAYIDGLIDAANGLVYKGSIDCSASPFPNYPAADAGHCYVVSGAGKIGGESGEIVEIGDMLLCKTDSSAEGDQATVGANWSIIQKNIDLRIAAQSIVANPTGSTAVQTAITVAEQTLVGRITGGNVDDLSVAQVKTLLGISSGAGASKTITQNSHGFAVGDVLKFASGVYSKAQADSAANAEVVGIVSVVTDVNTFDLLNVGFISGLSGLTAGTVYFLSPSSAGALTATEPTTVNQISKPLLIAVSTTEGYFYNFRGSVVLTHDEYISDTAYGTSWDGVTNVAPSKNAVYDQMELRAPKANPVFTGNITTELTASLPVFTDASKILISKSVANTLTALGFVSNTDYSSTTTVVGFSSMTYKDVYYAKNGNLVYIQYRFIGVSNSTDLTFTVPYTILLDVGQQTCRILNSVGSGVGITTPWGNKALRIYPDTAAHDWNSTGDKMTWGIFIYSTND